MEKMRSVVISSIRSVQLSCEEEIVGVESLPHLGLILVASRTTLILIRNEENIREIKWRNMDVEGDEAVVFGIIEGRAVCIFSSGIISSIAVDCDSCEADESMLSLGGDIVAGSINPITSVISLVLSDLTISIIDPLFDIMVEGVELKTKEKGLDELITVGWGSEKTQFQGKAGKEEREKKAERGNDGEGECTRECRIVWREDGEAFLVNYYDDNEKKRECTIWNAEGQLISRILQERRLEEWSAFRPMGNMIGVGCEGKVMMVERNGEIRNGVIRIDEVLKGVKIKEGAWNCDASILGLEVEKREEHSLTHYLMLWTCANLDWSCKLVVPFSGCIPAWRWDKEVWNELVVVSPSPSNEVFKLHLSLTTHSHNGIVVTMGTHSLRLTNLNRVVIPPPMSEITLPLPSPSALFFSANNLLSISHDRFIYHYSISALHSSRLSPSLLFSFPISIPTNAIISSISFVDSESDERGERIERGEYAVGFTHESIHYLAFFDTQGCQLRKISTASAVISMKKENDGSQSILLSDRSIYNEVNNVEGPSSTSILAYHKFCETGMGVYTLDYSSDLLYNGNMISHGVSSFTYSNPFIAWIDNSFNLHVTDTLTNETAHVRRLEHGSMLVSIAAPKVILQMPRGNLETIHSRFFVIRSVRSLLREGEVNTALILMKKHALSFSLLKEFSHFFSTRTDWLCTLEDVNVLSLVITELISIPECNQYCDILSSSILSLPSFHLLRFVPCLLTFLLLSKPSRAEDALRLIVDHLPKNSSRSSVLRHWLQVCSSFLNSSQIFSSSLSTYDLQFVVEVVEALSIDPNEYMDILRELNELSDLSYRAYKMDLLREDYCSALSSLSRCSPPRVNEVVDLIKSKSLYALSLRIYGDADEKDPLFDMIGRLALDYFSKEGKWVEGAMIGRVIGEYEEEMKLREKMNDVEGWVSALGLSDRSEEDREKKMNEWKNSLVKGGKWDTAAALLNHMNCGWEERMEIREKARDWKGILREVNNEKKRDVEIRGREILKKRSEHMNKEIKEKMDELERLSNRLNVVREKKKDAISRMVNEDIGLDDLQRCDAFSESSVSSRSSRSHSSRSSRSSALSRKTKKIEKKKASLKEGGEWEDAAILIVCHAHWETARQLLSESMSILPALATIRLFSSLSTLSQCLDRLESTLIRLSPIIWPSRLESHHLTGPLSHIYEEGGMPSEVGMPSFISVDQEMNPPLPLSEKEKGWRVVL